MADANIQCVNTCTTVMRIKTDDIFIESSLKKVISELPRDYLFSYIGLNNLHVTHVSLVLDYCVA